MIVAVAVILLAAVYYYLFHYGFDYFDEMDVKTTDVVPVFGSLWKTWKVLLWKWEVDQYENLGRIFGTFDGKHPNLIVGDPVLLKQLMVKDFDAFTNRREFPTEEVYVRRMVSLLRDQDWKDVRAAITPVFTTGKIKKMNPLMNECADALVKRLGEVAETSGKGDMKLYFGAYTMDVIATCAFGMKIDSLADPENPFIKAVQKIFNGPEAKSPLFLIPFVMPWIFKLFRMNFFPEDVKNTFITPLKEVFRKRKENPDPTRNDFVNMMIEAMEEEKKRGSTTLDEETVLSNAFIFLVAGYDTTATTLTMAAHCLATNPDIQEKLYQEIREKLEQYGDVTHEMINDMQYLEQCVNETLRMYPPLVRTEREASKDITLGHLPLKKGLVISTPIFAMHHDPEFYPDPWKYDPERFSPEEKSKRDPYTYLPFGLGPRNCIGMRFALEEAKIALCRALHKYKLTVCEDTKDPPEFATGFLQLIQPLKVIVGVEPRL